MKLMKAVYCYQFPESWKVLKDVEKKLLRELFLILTDAEKINLYDLEISKTKDGKVNLDEIHVPIIERIVKVYSFLIPKLKDFVYRYPSGGSSEGLFHLLVKYKNQGKKLYVLRGEYEGYEIQAKNIGLEVEVVNEKQNLKKLEPGIFFVSNPSARDGNIIPNIFIKKICEAGHKVVLDFAYVGVTKDYLFDVSHENIVAIVMSFSKPYGVFRFRVGGFIFSREPISTLYGNKWFKDIARLVQALRLAEEIGPGTLYRIYRKKQINIIKRLNKKYHLDLKPSDSLLLAYSESKLSEDYSDFKRGDKYRFCLTPYFEESEKF